MVADDTTVRIDAETSERLSELSDALAGASKKRLTEIAVATLYDEHTDDDGEITVWTPGTDLRDGGAGE